VIVSNYYAVPEGRLGTEDAGTSLGFEGTPHRSTLRWVKKY
jgi:hypothetical protein